MKNDKKAERLAALFGIEAPKKPTASQIRRSADVSREAEAVILFADQPDKFLQRPCGICGHTFAVNRSHIKFCSDVCRSEHINNVLGLDWDPTGRTVEDRWNIRTGGPEPLIVPPHALTLLLSVQEESLQSVASEQSTQEDQTLGFDLSSFDSLLGE